MAIDLGVYLGYLGDVWASLSVLFLFFLVVCCACVSYVIERAVYCLMDGGGVEWNEIVRRRNVVKAEIK